MDEMGFMKTLGAQLAYFVETRERNMQRGSCRLQRSGLGT